jgi:glutamate carboxypeptidase
MKTTLAEGNAQAVDGRVLASSKGSAGGAHPLGALCAFPAARNSQPRRLALQLSRIAFLARFGRAAALTPVIFALAAPCGAPPAVAQTLTRTEESIVRHVDEHTDQAIALLERIVNMNSGTMNHAGVREVGRVFDAELAGLGFETRWIGMPADVNRAGHLFAEIDGGAGRRLLLIGHLDTVFEEDSPFQRFERAGNMAAGPGVEDMKGGNVVLLYALKALQSAGVLDSTRIIVAFTGDEEKPGRPIDTSRADLIEAAQRSDFALGFEGGVDGTGTATVARRGSSSWRLRVSGERGHSSQIFGEQYGAGAILEAARILAGFYTEVRGEQYLTFNPGVILGGTQVSFDPPASRGSAFGKTNVIAQTVLVDGGLRFISAEQLERAREAMRRVVSQHLPRTAAEIRFEDGYPAMPPTEGNFELLGVLDRVSRDLGFGAVEAVDPGRRGAADISFAAPYIAGLDGLGVAGEGGHTIEEVVDLGSFPIVTKRAALLIYRLTRADGAP